MRPCRECGNAIANRETYCPTCQQRISELELQTSESEQSRIGRGVNISGEPVREEDRSYELFSILFACIMSGIGGMSGTLVAGFLGCLIGAVVGFVSTKLVLWALRQF